MTTDTHPAFPQTAEAPSVKPLVLWIAASAAAMVVGALGPWAEVADLVSVNGTEGDGWLILGAGLLAAALALPVLLKGTARRSLIIAAVVGALGAIIAAVDLADISSFAGGGSVFGGVVDTGWGLYLALAGSISVSVASVVAWLRTR